LASLDIDLLLVLFLVMRGDPLTSLGGRNLSAPHSVLACWNRRCEDRQGRE
jgi:hypothetical protein